MMRSTDDLKNFLGEHYNKESENPYWTQVETLQKLKVFGAGLFVKSFTTEKIIDPTLGAHMLLRQFLSELDAIIILLEQGATEQCSIHLRTMLELALQVEYMTENSNNERGLHYNLMFKLRQFGFYGSLVAGSEKGESWLTIFPRTDSIICLVYPNGIRTSEERWMIWNHFYLLNH